MMKKNHLLTLLGILLFFIPMHAGASYLDHPYYLHALSDLRAARWMLDHRPGNWQTSVDEAEAIRRIDAAIGEIKKAAIDDGKNIGDHPQVDEHPDRPGRLHEALDFLMKARDDIGKEEDNKFAQGLKARALMHIGEAINATQRAIASVQQQPVVQNVPQQHPAYLHALADLRAARWMISHRPGNWVVSVDESEAIRRIEAAIHEIKIASIDDGKDIEDHVGIDERPDHGGRLHAALDFLNRAKGDVMEPENNGFAQGLQDRAIIHINEAIRIVKNTMATIAAQNTPPPPPPQPVQPVQQYSQPVVQQYVPPQHPAYLHALSDLRAARWMLQNRPGNWDLTVDEIEAVRRIDLAIHEIKIAAIDDGKNIEDHPMVDEIPDHGGRLRYAADFLYRARIDVMQPENNVFAQGLQDRALVHINEALRIVNWTLFTVFHQPEMQHPAYLHALSDLRAARWMLENCPGNWDLTMDEMAAVQKIDFAISEIKRASIDDGKDINDHVGVDEIPDHGGRLHYANDFLLRARLDVSQPENNGYAQGLQDRALMHINDAIGIVQQAIASLYQQPLPPPVVETPPPPPPMQASCLSFMPWLI